MSKPILVSCPKCDIHFYSDELKLNKICPGCGEQVKLKKVKVIELKKEGG